VRGGEELLADGFFGAAAVADVAVDAAAQADLVRGVDVDGEGVERLQLRVVQGEDAFDDDDWFWHDAVEGSGDAGVGLEVVDGASDGFSVREFANVIEDQFGLQRVGVIEVALVTRVERKGAEVAVVEIEREERGVQLGGELGGEGGLAGAGTASDGEDDGFWVECGHRGKNESRAVSFAALSYELETGNGEMRGSFASLRMTAVRGWG